MKWKLSETQLQHLEERIAELFREIALLWLVFAVLDRFVAERLTFAWATLNFLFAVTVWGFGITMELRRIA